MEKLKLNQNQRKLLQIGVIVILAFFLIIYFFLINKKTTAPAVKNASVYLQDGKLYLFDETLPEPQYPDHILMHYPYLLLVNPNQSTTSIYDLGTKQKVKDVKQILLDYDGSNELYTKGKTTMFNAQDLGILCQYGWIKSSQDVLCVTQVQSNYAENKLADIDLKSGKQKDLYVSQNMITALSVINNNIYLGEIYLYNHKNYLLVNQDPIEVPAPVNLIYEMNNMPYFMSIKAALNQSENFYLITVNQAQPQHNNKVYLFK